MGVEEGHCQSEAGASYMSPLYEGYLVDPYIDSKGDTETVVTMSAYGSVLGWQSSPRFSAFLGTVGSVRRHFWQS